MKHFNILVLILTFFGGLLLSFKSPNTVSFSSTEKPKKRNYIDATFYYRVNDFDKDTVSSFRIDEIFNGKQANYQNAVNLYKRAFAQASYQDSLDEVRNTQLSLSESLLFLSLVGDRLNERYSADEKNVSDKNFIFLNAKNLDKNTYKVGGICGDIHAVAADYAAALGFVNIRKQSSLWQQDKKGEDVGGHFIYHFQDPVSKVYFLQNYSQIIHTGQTEQVKAIDVITRVLAPLTTVSFVESTTQRDKYHAYLPKTSRWVQANLEGFAEFSEDDPIVKLNISNDSNTMGVQVSADIGEYIKVKGFVLHSDFKNGDEELAFNAVGVAGEMQFTKKLSDKIIDEYSASVKGYGGYLQMSAPSYGQYYYEFTNLQKNSNIIFGSIKVKGRARINNTTGLIEIQNFTGDASYKTMKGSVHTKVDLGAEQDLNSKVKLGARRQLEVAKQSQNSTDYALQTHYDKVSVVFNSSQKEEKAYLVINSEYYIFSGIENKDASAIRASIKASFPLDKYRLGTLTFAYDGSRFLSNKSGDEFYNLKAAQTMSLILEKKLNKTVTLGSKLEYQKGEAYFGFQNLESVTPRLHLPQGFNGYIWLHTKI